MKILLVIFVLMLGVLGYYWWTIENPSGGMNWKLSGPEEVMVEKGVVSETTSQKERTERDCETYESRMRDACYRMKAKETQDREICEKIEKKEVRTDCLQELELSGSQAN
jgi:hypothetical protein